MKRILGVFTAFLVCLMLSSCYSKITTVRPSEISEMVVTQLFDSSSVTLPNAEQDADLMQRLIFQLEEPYDTLEKCTDPDEHIYQVKLYIGDKLDTDIYINADGSVCKNGRRYLPASAADEPVNISDWDALFAKPGEDISSPVAAEPQ